MLHKLHNAQTRNFAASAFLCSQPILMRTEVSAAGVTELVVRPSRQPLRTRHLKKKNRTLSRQIQTL